MSNQKNHDQLFALWSLQDSLLQSYRAIFITTEAIVFGIAVGIAQFNPGSALVLTVLGAFLLLMWHRVCSSRGRDVTFVQWLLGLAEQDIPVETPFLKFKRFQAGELISVTGRVVWKNKKPRDLEAAVEMDSAFATLGHSATRKWMERWLPIVFTLLWVIVLYIACRTLYATPCQHF